MTGNTPQEVVQKYHQAWTSGDVDTAMNYVSSEIVCRAPGVDLDGKDAYREFIAGFPPALTGIREIAEFADDNRVALFYYPETLATSSAPAAEFFTISDGEHTRIVGIEPVGEPFGA